jgi:hypothetical protein
MNKLKTLTVLLALQMGSQALAEEVAIHNVAEALGRCEQDWLGNNYLARGRVLWAYRCDYINYQQKMVFLTEYNHMIGQVVERDKIKFPVFTLGKSSSSPVWHAPTSQYAPCTKPSNAFSTLACEAGCFTPDQNLWFSDGDTPILDAFEQRKGGIMTLTNEATLEDLSYQSRAVDHYTASTQDEHEKIYVFKTDHSTPLKVTSNHPLVTGTGYLQRADSFKVGDDLVTVDGQKAEILEIDVVDYYGKVYNVMPASQEADGQINLKGQVIVAEGYLSGSSYMQNEGVQYLNKYNLRSSVPDSLDD